MATKKEGMHSGHRDRMRERVMSAGASSTQCRRPATPRSVLWPGEPFVFPAAWSCSRSVWAVCAGL